MSDGPLSVPGDEAELGKNIRKAFDSLTDREFEEADRQFRVAGCPGGRSFTAFKMGKPERSVYQGLKALKRLEGEDEHFPKERVVVLKSVKVSGARLRRRLSEGDLNSSRGDRVERLLERADPQIDDVPWGEVNAEIRELSEEWLPVFSGLLVEVGEGAEYRNGEIERGLELMSEGKLDEGFDVFYELHHAFPDSDFLGTAWAISPGFIPEYIEEVGKSEFERSQREILEMAGESDERKELEVFGLCLLNLSFYHRRRGSEIYDYFAEISADCLVRSLEGDSEDGFLRYHLGLCHALLGDHEAAIEHYDKVPEESSQWSSLAKRSKKRSQTRLEKIRSLKEDWEILKKAGEAEDEGDKEAELQYLEEVNNVSYKDFESAPIRIRRAELRIGLGEEPDPEALRKPIELDPDNEKIIG